MRPGTEDLLSIRDGQPVDAEARTAVDADPALQAEVARLEATRDRLRELPEFQPPPGVREKVFAELERDPVSAFEAPSKPSRSEKPGMARTPAILAAWAGFGRRVRRERSVAPRGSTPHGVAVTETAGVGNAAPAPQHLQRRYPQWPAGAAIAASVAVAAVLGVRSLDEPAVPAPDTLGAGSTITATSPIAAVEIAGPGGVAATYTSLTSESARLERLLNEIPYRPRVVNAGTATTITGLENRIGQVDEVLMYTSVNGLPPEQSVALWQERVDLMNALLEVRYAQAQRFGH